MGRFLAAISAVVILAAPSARATTIIDRSLPQMAKHSTLVVRGNVLDKRSEWGPRRAYIATRVRLKLTEVMKGNVRIGDELTILQSGGVVDGIGQNVSGAAKFEPGEEVVVFLETSKKTAGEFVLSSMAASKFKVTRDDKGVQLSRDLGHLTLAKPGVTGKLSAMPTTAPTTLTLDELRTSVRGASAR